MLEYNRFVSIFASLALLLLTLLPVVQLKKAPEDASNVIVLTSDNFEHDTQASTGGTTGDWFVEFYAPWCRHCQDLAPIWEELAESLKGQVNVAKVDVTENSDLAKQFGIGGYPTLIMFHDGKMYKYAGARTLEAMKKFAGGGYADIVGVPVPKPPTVSEQIIDQVVDVYRQTERVFHVAPFAFAFIFSLGVIIASILFMFISLCTGRKKERGHPRRTPNKKKD